MVGDQLGGEVGCGVLRVAGEDGEVAGVCEDTTNVVFNLLGEKSLF